MASYGKKAHDKVGEELHELKRGKLRSGSGRKVTSRKQAIAIGLAEARREGGKVPPAPKSSTRKSSSKSASGTKSRSTSAKRSTGTKSRSTTAKRSSGTKSHSTTAKRSSGTKSRSTTAKRRASGRAASRKSSK